MTDVSSNSQQHAKVVVERVFGDRIHVFRLLDSTRRAIDEYYDVIDETRHSWPVDQPFYCIFDVSNRAVVMNTYARQRMNELSYSAPDGLHGAYAVVLPNTLVGALIRVFMRVLPNRNPEFVFEAFTDYEKALAWVEEQIADL
jgi:hypothetical protein